MIDGVGLVTFASSALRRLKRVESSHKPAKAARRPVERSRKKR